MAHKTVIYKSAMESLEIFSKHWVNKYFSWKKSEDTHFMEESNPSP